MDPNLFVDNLLALRKFLRISQPQLASTLNTSTATISKWERKLLKTMPDNKAVEIFEKLRKVSNFPYAINLEMFLQSDLNEILKNFEMGKSSVFDKVMAEISHEDQKTKGLQYGLFEFLTDVKMRTLNQPTQEEIEEMKCISFSDWVFNWADKYFFADVLFHIRRAKGKIPNSALD